MVSEGLRELELVRLWRISKLDCHLTFIFGVDRGRSDGGYLQEEMGVGRQKS